MRKEPTRKALKAKCDALWSKCVRTRQRVCQLCGSDYHLQAHHIQPRKHMATRYDLDNGLCLCSRCHCLQRFDSCHFYDRVRDHIDEERYRRLQEKASRIVTDMNIRELMIIQEKLTAELKALESDWGELI
jgi:hypothetical protein